MKSKRQYSINLSCLLIISGMLQLIWPGYFWLGLYRFFAVIGLFHLLLSTAMVFSALKHDRFVSKGCLMKQKFKLSIGMVNGLILLLAWMLKDSWAWWLTLALIVAGWGTRWMMQKFIKSLVPPLQPKEETDDRC